MPLSLVLRFGKVLLKKVELAAAPWKRPPVQVMGGPSVHPVNPRLTALGVRPAACTALMASTMLFLGSPAAPTPPVFACEAVSGAVVPNALEILERSPS